MDIVVKGRNVEVPEHYRRHVSDKLRKIERYDGKIIRVDVELSHEKNPRQSGRRQRVEITCASRGPIVRGEACASDFYAALDAAIAKLEARLRRSADRRRVHRGRRAPISVAAATSGLPVAPDDLVDATLAAQRGLQAEKSDAFFEPSTAAVGKPGGEAGHDAEPGGEAGYDAEPVEEAGYDAEPAEDADQPWHIVRMKEHPAEPMTVEDALFQMELVGHDFYLFTDKDSERPSVVYRRHAYDYGVISLGQGG